MNVSTLPQSQQSLGRSAPAGSWQLEAGRALSLRAREDAVLRVTQGRMWVTFDGPHRGAGNAWGDHFLLAGEQIPVSAGQRVVIESMGMRRGAPAFFCWEPVAAGVQPPVRMAGHWQQGVAQPLADVRRAVGLALDAIGRLWVVGWAGCCTGRQSRGALGSAGRWVRRAGV